MKVIAKFQEWTLQAIKLENLCEMDEEIIRAAVKIVDSAVCLLLCSHCFKESLLIA